MFKDSQGQTHGHTGVRRVLYEYTGDVTGASSIKRVVGTHDNRPNVTLNRSGGE